MFLCSADCSTQIRQGSAREHAPAESATPFFLLLTPHVRSPSSPGVQDVQERKWLTSSSCSSKEWRSLTTAATTSPLRREAIPLKCERPPGHGGCHVERCWECIECLELVGILPVTLMDRKRGFTPILSSHMSALRVCCMTPGGDPVTSRIVRDSLCR